MKKNPRCAARKRSPLVEPTSEEECAELNDELEAEALAEFENTDEAKFFREEGDFILGCLVSARNSLLETSRPPRYGSYDNDDLVRAISTDVRPIYPCWGESDDGGYAEGWFAKAWTPAAEIQSMVLKALKDFLFDAASLAKTVGSPSVRLWARAINLLEDGKGEGDDNCRINRETAAEIVAAMKSATNDLQDDVLIGKLPPFRPKKPSACGKASRKGKR